MPLCLCSFLSPLFASSPSLVLLHLLFSFSSFQSAYILSPFQLTTQKVGYVTRVTDLYSESLVRKCSKCQISFLRKSWETRGIGWKELITTYIFVEKETRSKGNFHFHKSGQKYRWCQDNVFIDRKWISSCERLFHENKMCFLNKFPSE